LIKKILPLFATLLASTLRIQWVGESLPQRAVVAFWHGKMFGGWWSQHKRRPIAMVSKSKDGEILSSVLKGWKYQLARGSSSTNGREALEEAMQAIRQGKADTLVITPDGPRGPYHQFKRGVFLASYDLSIPLYFIQVTYSKAHTFERSWDKFEVPYPFSKVTLAVSCIKCDEWPFDPEKQKQWMERQANEIEKRIAVTSA